MSDLISRDQAISKSFHIQTDEWWGDVVSVENLMELPEISIITELEKIKEEIETQTNKYDRFMTAGNILGMQYTIVLIDKHIEKLKGE